MMNEPLSYPPKNSASTSEIISVFLAEDDIDDQELLIEAFAGHNEKIKVTTATNGKKALTILEGLKDNELPCLIVLDYNLPEINGGEILKILKGNERFADIPKVVWSTSNSPQYKQICLNCGASAYFVKPSEISGIEKLAKEMLGFCKQ
jgi:CheY-like chemotaxis protein